MPKTAAQYLAQYKDQVARGVDAAWSAEQVQFWQEVVDAQTPQAPKPAARTTAPAPDPQNIRARARSLAEAADIPIKVAVARIERVDAEMAEYDITSQPDYEDSAIAQMKGMSLEQYRSEKAETEARRVANERQNLLNDSAGYRKLQAEKATDRSRAEAERKVQVDRYIRNGNSAELADRLVPALETFFDQSVQSKTAAIEAFDGFSNEDAMAWMTTPNVNPFDRAE